MNDPAKEMKELAEQILSIDQNSEELKKQDLSSPEQASSVKKDLIQNRGKIMKITFRFKHMLKELESKTLKNG